MLTSSREAELRCYWDACLSLNTARAASDPKELILELVEEIEAVGDYTDWPALKAQCAQTAGAIRDEIYGRAVYA